MKLQLTFCVALDRYMKDLEYIFTAHSDGIRVEGHPGGFLGWIILFCLLLVFISVLSIGLFFPQH